MPSPAMVVAIVALVAALGGSAYAVKKIGTKQLANKAVSTKKLKNIGTDLGGAVKGFKDGVRDGGAAADAAATPPAQVNNAAKANEANTVDVEAKTKS